MSDKTQADAAAEATAGTPQMGNDPGQEPGAEQEKTFDAAYVKQLRAEAASYRKELQALKDAETGRQADARKAEEKRLAEQQKWQELAEKRENDLTTAAALVETLTQRAERAEIALQGYLDKLSADVPDHIKSLLDHLDIVARLEYLTKHAGELKPKQAHTPGAPAPQRRTTPAAAPTPRRTLTL